MKILSSITIFIDERIRSGCEPVRIHRCFQLDQAGLLSLKLQRVLNPYQVQLYSGTARPVREQEKENDGILQPLKKGADSAILDSPIPSEYVVDTKHSITKGPKTKRPITKQPKTKRPMQQKPNATKHPITKRPILGVKRCVYCFRVRLG